MVFMAGRLSSKFDRVKIVSFGAGLRPPHRPYSGPCLNLASFKAALSARPNWHTCAPF